MVIFEIEKFVLLKKEKLDSLIILMQRFCDYTERSSWDVRTKLRKQGVSGQDIEMIIEQLKDEKYIDDERFAIQFAQGKNKYNKWGKNKIRSALHLKKIDSKSISSALDSIDTETYGQVLESVYLGKYNSVRDPNLFNKKNKTIKHCLDKGFEYELIRELSQRLHST